MTFIKFSNFIKVSLNFRIVILTIEELVSNPELFQIFILSLLFTKNTLKASIMCYDDIINDHTKWYGIITHVYNKNNNLFNYYYKFFSLYKSRFRNPLNAQEPKRSTSSKKIKKFFKLFYRMYYDRMTKKPLVIINEYIQQETFDICNYIERLIQYEKKIEILSNILHNYGYDVYSNIIKFV
jgi:hypothetical protein